MRLKLPSRQQIIVGSLFAGGLFATVAGAVRTAITFSFTNPANFDKTRNAIPIIIASALELFIGIPFFARFLPQLIGNPASWRSRNGQSRAIYGRTLDQKPGRDFWLVTKDRQSTNIDTDIESRSLPLMPGMPTPTKPPQIQSLMPSLLIQEPSRDINNYQKLFNKSRHSSFSSNTTASTTILSSFSAVPKPLNLNKPLPTPRLSMDMGEGYSREQEMERNDTSRTPPANMLSVYKFVPHLDGHIRVHKTREIQDI
ncbi:hypothetical protein N0V82_007844 [Gnomoniopsis sp. IMI 355080]|nr:hypothetical protein N0V82_007844 [Gnomoniopsis sp. IMI 355080]